MTYLLKTEFDGTLLTNQMLTIIIDLIYKFIIYLLQQLFYYHKIAVLSNKHCKDHTDAYISNCNLFR